MRLLIIVILLINTTNAAQLVGKVVGVHDGDTITLLTKDKQQVKIRLRHIDAPELKQPYGKESKKALSNLLYQQKIVADCHGKSLGRFVCDVVTDANVDIQYEMVKIGAVWVYPKYNRREDLPPLQMQARRQRIGIWGLPSGNWVAPWKYRK